MRGFSTANSCGPGSRGETKLACNFEMAYSKSISLISSVTILSSKPICSGSGTALTGRPKLKLSPLSPVARSSSEWLDRFFVIASSGASGDDNGCTGVSVDVMKSNDASPALSLQYRISSLFLLHCLHWIGDMRCSLDESRSAPALLDRRLGLLPLVMANPISAPSMPSSPSHCNARPLWGKLAAFPSSKFTIALGRLARRGFAGIAGRDRSGRVGFPFSRLNGSVVAPMAVGACDPSALERDIGGSGADVERGVTKSAADVMNVFGSYSCINPVFQLGPRNHSH